METHPIANGFIDENSEVIIIGTFPPITEYNNNPDFFFYSSVKNHFWNRIENLFPEYKLKKTSTKLIHISKSQNKIDKQKFCLKHKIGFLDIFTKIERKNKNSSKDSDLIPKENIFENEILFNCLEKNKNINRFCCTYKLAFDTIISCINKKYLEKKKNEICANGIEYIYHYKERKIRILLLYPATRSREKRENKDLQYKKLIFEI